MPKNGWEINNYQQDFLTLLPNATIKAGTKSLTFLEVVPKKKLKKNAEGSKKSSAKTASALPEDDSIKKDAKSSTMKKDESAEPKPVDSANSTAPVDPIADA